MKAMKLLLVAINAKYIHSNPAVYSLKAYAKKYRGTILIKEYTINNSREEILRDIYLEHADFIGFSCYIWNIVMIRELLPELRKVQPGAFLWLGGPEVSYHSGKLLDTLQAVDGIVVGEGEQTFLELAEYYQGEGRDLEEIKGIVFRESARLEAVHQSSPRSFAEGTVTETVQNGSLEDTVRETLPREPFMMDEIPFPYQEMDALRNRIVYYESSRGCPYTCSYCLSSVDRSVKYRSMELVKKELLFFLDHHIPQVKFIDRTFNCNRQRALEIWSFLKERDNGLTNFHFEITADLLSEEELNVLASLRPGQVQLEIGVQTTNPDTMSAIRRRVDFKRLSKHVVRLREGHNIHLHLDLIAGLPLEDLDSFKQSFQEVYRLKPDQLQLGFLKVLKGSPMEEESEHYGIVYRELPPYEVLYTGVLSFRELLLLKGVCDMVEVYYNSGQFQYSLEYLVHFYPTPFDLYQALAGYYEEKGHHRLAHSRMKRYEILLDFYRDKVLELGVDHDLVTDLQLFQEILLFDVYLREDVKSRPYFAGVPLKRERYNKLREALQLGREPYHIEHFTYDVMGSAAIGTPVKKEMDLLFRYDRRDPISYSAMITMI